MGYLDGAIYRLRGVEISYRAARQRPIRAVRLRRTIALFAASLTLLGIAAPVIAADEEWEFQGGGWGHGVGLSQFGALGQAQDGRRDSDPPALLHRNLGRVDARGPLDQES